MYVRRHIAATPLASLEPVFASIRSDAGVRDGYNREAYFEAEHGDRQDELAHIVDAREDLTAIPLATIDPLGSRDLDQAVAIETDGAGHVVHYAIADVAAHVVPGGALDADTRQRVETVYCPDRRIGLHPPTMSEGYASLLPDARRKAVVWTLSVGADGELTNIVVRRAWVRSRAQYAYTQLHEQPPADAAALLTMLAEVGERRRALARRRGAVTLPKPSQETRVEGQRVTLEFRAGLPIEDDNAQISLMTGEAAATLMLEAGAGILRTMPPASDTSVRRLRHQAKALGVAWAEDQSYSEMLDGLEKGAPATAAFLTQAVTLFRGARWEAFDDSDPELPRPDTLTHGALGVPYAHVTAPLRRLVDRYGTEVCVAHAAKRAVPQWVRDALPWIGQDMARGVHVNKNVDRACIDAVESAMLSDFVGDDFDGVGLDDNTVQLSDPAIIAKCEGDVAPGIKQRVRLISARPEAGPIFTVASRPGRVNMR